ncbi:MAG TPA: ABC transporter permease/substrate-binding protein [Gemmataceae bacterium]|nr:ABC transporter permease/substrate-binding protein [Gemmataceae bacterium]
MSEQWGELLKQLPAYLGGHVLLSLAAMAVGLAVSLPLGVVVSRRKRWAEITLTLAGIVQTVPSLALLALMVLLLGLIGFRPAFVALTLYSILPILANTITGIRGVDPTLVEAARGLGMNDRQVLFRVQLPLAAPVIVSGIRTATVLVVGTATLVTPVGGRSLGNYIFQGLESLNYTSVAFGCVLVALLAIALDQLIHRLEMAARERSRRRAGLVGLGLLVVLAVGLFPLGERYLFAQPPQGWVRVGTGPFTEQHILSELLDQQMGPAGFRADKRQGMSEGIQFEALRQDQLDCMVNYTGNVWVLLMKQKEFTDRQTVLDEVSRYFKEQGVECIPLGYENAYALAMRRAEADRLGIRTISDLAEHAPHLKLGTDQQFLARPEWFQARDTYGLQFARARSMDATIMYDSLKVGEVDVISAYTSDGRIKAYDLVLLGDDKKVFPPYDVVLLVSPKAAARPGFLEALRPLQNGIDLDLMQNANKRVDVEGWTAPRAAGELLEKAQSRRVVNTLRRIGSS